MISAPPQLLAPDARLPQRDALLDPATVAGRLGARLGRRGPIAIEHCSRTRVKYWMGRSLRVLYEIEVHGVPHFVSARTFDDGRSRQVFERASATAVPCGDLSPLVHDAELNTVFWTFPNDRKIVNLTTLQAPPGSLGSLPAQAWRTSRIVAYVPEKAATAQCLDVAGNTVAYAKIYADDAGQRTATVYSTLAAHVTAGTADLRLPRAIGYSEPLRMLLLEPIDGWRPSELDGGALREASRRFGAALARLHALPPPDGRRHERLDPERLQQAAELMGRVRPDLARIARSVADELTARSQPSGDRAVCLHGDLNFKNWIVTDDHVALIDLDSVCGGPAAADVGSVLAGLRYRYRIGRSSRVVERQLVGAFLEGYASVRALPAEATLRWYTAAALLGERAHRAINRLLPEALPHVDGLLADAHTTLRNVDDV